MPRLVDHEARRREITDAGFDGYIGKPINLKEFVETVRRSVEGRAS